jgi:chloramphenicol-sensitive protein RarD
LQWVAIGLAAVGVIILTVFTGAFPWMAIGLALTFGFYGFIKKKLPLSALEGLATETFASLPIAAALLLVPFGSGAVTVGAAAACRSPCLGYIMRA